MSNLPGNDGTIDPRSELPDYDILNASLAFSFDDDRYRISLIAKNLTDESYVTTFSGDGFRYQVPGTLSVILARRFGFLSSHLPLPFLFSGGVVPLFLFWIMLFRVVPSDSVHLSGGLLETRREPIHGGSSPASLLSKVSRSPTLR